MLEKLSNILEYVKRGIAQINRHFKKKKEVYLHLCHTSMHIIMDYFANTRDFTRHIKINFPGQVFL